MGVLVRFFCFLLIFGSIEIVRPAFLFAGSGREIVFGRVHDDPVRSIKDRQEFVDYFAKRLSAVGITGGRILVVDKIHLLGEALRDGKVDVFHDSLVPVMVLARSSGAIPILRQWKYGEADYEGVIVVKKNSGIDTLADLKGRVIAFEEPHSTSAHVLPRMLIEQQKLKLVQVKSPGAVRPDVVGYIHGSDGNSPNLLMTGRVDAATTTLREIERLKPEVRDSLKVIGKSKTVPRQLIAVRKDLDPKIVHALKEILLKMDQDPEGQGVLKRQQNTAKIDEFTPGAMQQYSYIEKYVFSSLADEVNSW